MKRLIQLVLLASFIFGFSIKAGAVEIWVDSVLYKLESIDNSDNYAIVLGVHEKRSKVVLILPPVISYGRIDYDVNIIGEQAFYMNDHSNLEQIVIPRSVKYIRSKAFDSCKKLKFIYVSWQQLDEVVVADDAFWNMPLSDGCILSVPPGTLQNYEKDNHPDTRTILKWNTPSPPAISPYYDGKTRYYDGKTRLGIKSSEVVVEWSSNVMDPIFQRVFVEKWEPIPVVDHGFIHYDLDWNTLTATVDVSVYSKYGVLYPDTDLVIRDFVYDSSILLSLKLPFKVTKIADAAFSDIKGITNVILPAGIESIGKNAFSECQELTSINIPSGVSVINDGTFRYCKSLKSVDISGSIKEVGSWAFQGCLMLEAVTVSTIIGDKCFSIGGDAFRNCTSIKSITIPSNMLTIGYYAFMGCSSVESIIFEEGTTGFAAGRVFADCSSLKSITLPQSLIHIGDFAFENCNNIEDIYYYNAATYGLRINMTAFTKVPEGSRLHLFKDSDPAVEYKWYGFSVVYDLIAYAPDYVFDNITYIFHNDYTASVSTNNGHSSWADYTNYEVKIPDTINYQGKNYTVTAIIQGAFQQNDNIVSITLPNTITNIGPFAFAECINLTSVKLPANITDVEAGTFYNCTALKFIHIPDKVENLEYSCFRGCGELDSITIPKSVTRIGEYAFADCKKMMNIYLEWDYPDRVTAGDFVFFGLSSICRVHAPLEYAANYKPDWLGLLVSNYNFSYHYNNNTFTASIERNSDYMLPDIAIPGTVFDNGRSYAVTSISSFAFEGNKHITSIRLPNSIKEIDESAFSGCVNLEKVSIGEGVILIENQAFYNCPKLKDIAVFWTDPKVARVGADAFAGVSDKCLVHVPVHAFDYGDKWEGIKVEEKDISYSFNNINLTAAVNLNNTSLNNIIILPFVNYNKYDYPVVKISEKAFYGYDNIKTISLPNTITNIESFAFYECSSLTGITIPNVVNIGYNAFRSANSIESITFGENLKSISGFAFADCKNLRNIYVEFTDPKLVTVDPNAFSNIPSDCKVHVLSGTESVFGTTWQGLTVVGGYIKPEIPETPEEPEDPEIPVVVPEEPKDPETPVVVPEEPVQPDEPALPNEPDRPEYPDQVYPNRPSSNQPNAPEVPAEAGHFIGIFGGIAYDFNPDQSTASVAINNGVSIGNIYTGASDVIIPSSIIYDKKTYTVTSINKNAFTGHKKITSLTIPISITSMGNESFANCVNLKKINLKWSEPDVATVGSSAFAGISSDCKVYVLKEYGNNYGRTWQGFLVENTLSSAIINDRQIYYTNGMVTVAGYDGLITITSLTGRIIARLKGDNQYPVHLSSGIYLINASGINYTNKIIVK
ncbi:Beta antigen [Bacteroidales bacterium Barb4]|nr:Beta antigen [Bacteroidales bacterium Barb4]